MTAYKKMQDEVRQNPKAWLVTGAAGFIGSNLVETLLKLNQKVGGLDNFATGHAHNLDEVRSLVSPDQWSRFEFCQGDIRDEATCKKACGGIDYVLHQAALGSVPRSIEDPLTSNAANVTGFVNMIAAAHAQGVKRFVYASSSAVYGDHPDLPKVEGRIGECLSPYAVTKFVNELYASVFARCYGLEPIGLRYFNVFGPRQDPEGPYAAVIPKWISALIRNQPIQVNGDGETSRDFCFIDNVVQANLLAATTLNQKAANTVYNVALNDRTTLNQLFKILRDCLAGDFPHLRDFKPTYRDFRAGDVRHSQADISKAHQLLGYSPTHNVEEGLRSALAWYKSHVV